MSCDTIRYDFCVKQGQDETRQVTVVDAASGLPIDITGYTLSSEIRVNYSDASPIETISCSIINGLAGIFIFNLTHTQTTNLREGSYVFDIKMINLSNYVIRIVEGTVSVSPEVTR